MGLSWSEDDLAADETQQPQRVGQRATEPSPFQRRQIRLPDPHGLGGIGLRHPGRGTEMLQRRAQIPRTEHEVRSEEHTSELQSPVHLVCRLLLEKKKKQKKKIQLIQQEKKKTR